MFLHKNGKFTMGKLKSFICRKTSFLPSPFQGMKQMYLYLWHLLFQPQWDRSDHQNHQIYNYLLKGHHLYSGKWNERIGLASFRFSSEVSVWSLSHMNKGTSRQEEEVNVYSYVCRVCCKTRPSNSKYVVNQNHEHVDDISFRELFSRIRLFFHTIRSVPS